MSKTLDAYRNLNMDGDYSDDPFGIPAALQQYYLDALSATPDSPVDPALLESLADALSVQGPDSLDLYYSEDGNPTDSYGVLRESLGAALPMILGQNINSFEPLEDILTQSYKGEFPADDADDDTWEAFTASGPYHDLRGIAHDVILGDYARRNPLEESFKKDLDAYLADNWKPEDGPGAGETEEEEPDAPADTEVSDERMKDCSGEAEEKEDKEDGDTEVSDERMKNILSSLAEHRF